jgi:hypothetical protein
MLAGSKGKIALQGADVLLPVIPLPRGNGGYEGKRNDDHYSDADPEPYQHRVDGLRVDDHLTNRPHLFTLFT